MAPIPTPQKITILKVAKVIEILVRTPGTQSWSLEKLGQIHKFEQLAYLEDSSLLATSMHDLVSRLCGEEKDGIPEGSLSHSMSGGQIGFDEICRILKSLLHTAMDEKSQLRFLDLFNMACDLWWHGPVKTTLHSSHFYGYMLFAECFIDILTCSTGIHFSNFAKSKDVQYRAHVIALQIVTKVLSLQEEDGLWGTRPEQRMESTTFAILSLLALERIPFLALQRVEMRDAIELGQRGLSKACASYVKISPAWKAALVNQASYLENLYYLLAMRPLLHNENVLPFDAANIDPSQHKILSLAHFFHGLPNLSNDPFYIIKAAAIESSIHAKELRLMRRDIFPGTAAKEKDKYFDYIPIMFSIHSFVRKVFTPPQFVWDMSVISMFIFIVDEYMESHVASFSVEELKCFRQGIEEIFASTQISGARYDCKNENGNKPRDSSNNEKNGTSWKPDFMESDGSLCVNEISTNGPTTASFNFSVPVQAALSIFSSWITSQLQDKIILEASIHDRMELRLELHNYILCHVQQIEDNRRLASQSHNLSPLQVLHPRIGYAQWLQTTGGGHIGGPLGLVYFSCHVGTRIRGHGKDCFSSVKQKLIAWNANTHESMQLRMFNDYGSIQRDASEDNLNSVNFPEFFGSSDEMRMKILDSGDNSDSTLDCTKRTLLEAAFYERERTNEELGRLYEDLRNEGAEGSMIADLLGVYYAGADQFSEMYLVRDVTNSTK